LRKKGIRRRGGHALKRERHLASRGTRAGGQQNVVGGAKKKKTKIGGLFGAAAGWRRARMNRRSTKFNQASISPVSLYALHPKE
jgi:hypothetical protein